MADFLNNMKKQASLTLTQNDAVAYNTTQNPVLDFFAESSALRNSSDKKIVELFDKAYIEDPLLTMKCVFYLRDVRGGQGERRAFRVLIKHIATTRPEVMKKNLNLISEYGRYDDLMLLLDTPLKTEVTELISEQLKEDSLSENPSLLAKWMPSCDTSSYKTRRTATNLRKSLGMTEEEYRKMLSGLRRKLKVTESIISREGWDGLNLEKLTSKNYVKYQKAFVNHIPEKWNDYIDAVRNGKSEIKSATLYPYDIIRQVRKSRIDQDLNVLSDELWKALPDYTSGKFENALCMVDVSASMLSCNYGNVTPIDVSISLGLYIAERVKGDFKNHFLTFSQNPEIVEIKGNNLREKVWNVSRAGWGYNTDLNKAFELILETAINNNTPPEDMPKKLIIISDMQFDSANRGNNSKSLFEEIKERFMLHGYNMPVVVFWNVDSKKTAFQVCADSTNVLLCSGCSPSILKGVLKHNNPMELLLDTLNNPRYDLIAV